MARQLVDSKRRQIEDPGELVLEALDAFLKLLEAPAPVVGLRRPRPVDEEIVGVTAVLGPFPTAKMVSGD